MDIYGYGDSGTASSDDYFVLWLSVEASVEARSAGLLHSLIVAKNDDNPNKMSSFL